MMGWFESTKRTMVNVLAGNSRRFSYGVLHIANLTNVLELSTLGLESLSHVLVVAIAELALLDDDQIVCVTRGEPLGVE
jgi:hypothetical protein